jgi:hypothetical protein
VSSFFDEHENKAIRRIKKLQKSEKLLLEELNRSEQASQRLEARMKRALRRLKELSSETSDLKSARKDSARSDNKGKAMSAGGELLFLRAKSIGLQSDVYLSWMQQLHHERSALLYRRLLKGDDVDISLRELFEYPTEIASHARVFVDSSSIVDIDWEQLLATADDEHFAVALREFSVEFPEQVSDFMKQAIEDAKGREVFFVAMVRWDDEGLVATLDEVEVGARGNDTMVPAVFSEEHEWDLVIHNHPTGDLSPSEADLQCANILSRDNIGFAIVNNDITEHYLVVKPNPRVTKS